MKIFKSAILFLAASSSLYAQHTLPALPYSYSALEPVIDSATMYIHHTKHHAGYINNLNKTIKGTWADTLSIVPLNGVIHDIIVARNNAGGHYNHSFFWKILTPEKNTQPSPRLAAAINSQFGSLDSLKTLVTKTAMDRFGSGWVWVYINDKNKIEVCSTPNQDNTLMKGVSECLGTPILAIDVWEHAYYLNYQNKRADYLKNIWTIINWKEVSRLYEEKVPKGKFDDWQALKDFHKVMSQTFHPSEKGDLAPIKSRSDEMVEKAVALAASTIPAEFNTKEVKAAVAELVVGSKKLDKLVKKGGKDADVTKSLNALHDVFHKIIGLCTHDDHDH
jgi:superoxide dismutase